MNVIGPSRPHREPGPNLHPSDQCGGRWGEQGSFRSVWGHGGGGVFSAFAWRLVVMLMLGSSNGDRSCGRQRCIWGAQTTYVDLSPLLS